MEEVISMKKKVFQLLVENTSGVLSRISGLFARRGYNIESITAGVETIINREKVDMCVTIGPAIMMKFVSLLTKKYEIPTVASLNTIMVDGTGMCGACRVTIDGVTKFVCVDGPEFDAHKVNFDEMMMRLSAYKPEEAEAFNNYKNQNC